MPDPQRKYDPSDYFKRNYGMYCVNETCHSSDVSFIVYNVHKDVVELNFECNKCRSTWIGSYEPSIIENFVEGRKDEQETEDCVV